MKYWGRCSRRQAGILFTLVLAFFYPLKKAQAAEMPPPVTQPDVQMTLTKQATDPDALSLDQAVLMALDNHPNVRAAHERIGAQQAVLGQQMAAYYPTISMSNFYQTSTQSGTTTGVTDGANDTFLSRASFNMTLYNFGKREGTVQAARETLDATGYNYKTTVDSVVFGVKQAYYAYLQARAIVRVREETVASRDLLVKQARGFYEVGTRARIDVVRAESNLYSAQADLIAAQNAVKVAWVTLKNAIGLRELVERPLVEEVTMATLPYTLDEAREIAYKARPELKSFEAQRRAQDQNIATARRGHLPDIIFDANYRRSNNSDPPGNTFPLQAG